MTGFRSVREIALENEVSQLKLENKILSHKLGVFEDNSVQYGPSKFPPTLSVCVPAPAMLHLIAKTDTRWTPHGGYEVQSFGLSQGKNRFEHTMYVENREMYQHNDVLQLLGELYEQTIRGIAAHWEKKI